MFHALKKRNGVGKDCAAIKLDMSKAYDRVEWDFLRKTLIAYGFDANWVILVMKLVTFVTYRYKVNGHLSDKLIPHRGLRQGDPLSPYLFILVADVLSHMLTKAQEGRIITRIRLAAEAPFLTHLFFADDALLFAKATPEEMFQLIRLLNSYCLASGQKINVTKSGIIFGAFVQQTTRIRLQNILHMQTWSNPGRYLGVPAN